MLPFGIDILTFLIFAPIIGGVIVLLLPDNKTLARIVALAIALE